MTLIKMNGWTADTDLSINDYALGAILPDTYENLVPVTVSSFTENTSSEIIVKSETEEKEKITDWKNHVVFQGDTYEFIYDVKPVLTSVLKGASIVLWPVLMWVYKYKWNPAGFVAEAVQKILNYSTSIGLLKDKIEVDFSKTKLSSDFETFTFRFTVIQNAWQLIFIGAAITAVFGLTYLSLREVYKITKEKPAAGFVAGLSLGTIGAIAGLLLLVPSLLKK